MTHPFKQGDRVRLKQDIDAFNLGSFTAGIVGTVVDVATDEEALAHGRLFDVKLDDHHEDLDEWENQLQVFTLEDGSEVTVECWEHVP